MSFEEFEDCFIWQCDKCGLSAEFPSSSFWHGHAELKARGWRFTRDDEGSWSHACGKCKAKADKGLLDRPSNQLRSV